MDHGSENRSSGAWRTPAYVVFALFCALVLAAFSRLLAAAVAALALAPLVIAAMRATRARLGEVPPEFATSPETSHAGMREFASLPFDNPFDPAHSDLPLDARITMAAEASAEFSRGASVLYLRTPPNVDAAGVLAILRAAVRPTDHVEMIGPGEIVACLNLIRDLSNVDGVIARLTQRLHDNGWPQGAPPRFGRALYPMHGYSGADLIAAARAQLQPAAAPAARRDGARKEAAGARPRRQGVANGR